MKKVNGNDIDITNAIIEVLFFNLGYQHFQRVMAETIGSQSKNLKPFPNTPDKIRELICFYIGELLDLRGLKALSPVIPPSSVLKQRIQTLKGKPLPNLRQKHISLNSLIELKEEYDELFKYLKDNLKTKYRNINAKKISLEEIFNKKGYTKISDKYLDTYKTIPPREIALSVVAKQHDISPHTLKDWISIGNILKCFHSEDTKVASLLENAKSFLNNLKSVNP